MRVPALIAKEWRLLLRDWHALLLLFVMPAAFILVMSLALQDRLSSQQGVGITYYLVNHDHSAATASLLGRFGTLKIFSRLPDEAAETELMKRVRRDQAQFLVVIPSGFGANLAGKQPRPLQVYSGPGVEPAVEQLFEAAIRAAIARVYLQQRLMPMLQMPGTSMPNLDAVDNLLLSDSLYRSGGRTMRPSSVQQNVPAWLLFAMFFIAIPLSTTWVQERQQGTYARLRSMGLGAAALLTGKLAPYLVINLLQAGVMLLVGIFLVPWLGGDSLSLGHAPAALLLMALASGFAAVSFGLLVANFAGSNDQAMIFTGVVNLLMAALGGIMVPSFMMPPVMQAISHYSPMAWGLQGFLDVLLRQGGLGMVAPEAAALAGFGVACLLLAALRFKRLNNI